MADADVVLKRAAKQFGLPVATQDFDPNDPSGAGAAALMGAGRTDSLSVVGPEDLRAFEWDNAVHAGARPGTLHGKHPAEHI
jgi:hypothetical protein